MGGTSQDGGKPEATDNGKDYFPTYVPNSVCLAVGQLADRNPLVRPSHCTHSMLNIPQEPFFPVLA